nr:unnamed protein product [Callosobruchus chinensis]CAH7736227.1 unnamed protein product [Callosobruchus chinensis]
MQCREGQFD